jgi:hypothetical protein
MHRALLLLVGIFHAGSAQVRSDHEAALLDGPDLVGGLRFDRM